jgi:CRISPR-associated endonuclease/helicase Cas3
MLADRAAAAQWPHVIDLPTAAGKTACIDVAIYALAFQAQTEISKRTAPRRIWFVVDRRLVVDEAFERASRIAGRLQSSPKGPLRVVADRLRMLSGTDRPLAVARLRGGILCDDNWGRLPSQPAVITSTVDQLGSRMLFRGYGRSNLVAPIFAGLAANDSLILLDEAHCSVPFMQTLQGVRNLRASKWSEQPIETPFAFAVLSATPGALPQEEIFPGIDRQRALEHAVLQRRLSVSKPAVLRIVPADKRDETGTDALVSEAVELAWRYAVHKKKSRVAVMVNRVKTATEIFDSLSKRLATWSENNEDTLIEVGPQDGVSRIADPILLTGRMRSYERDRLVEKWTPYLRANAPEQTARPIVLVTTQCLEVGADFSFDALVTEVASLDALRQRFGRLNRFGNSDNGEATILIRKADLTAAHNDPIYGTAMSRCWQLLDSLATTCGTRGKDKIVDFGVDAMDKALADIDDLSPYLAPHPNAPALLPAYLDLFCQTTPRPAVEPDTALFLHGKDRGVPEARLIFRSDLTLDDRSTWQEVLALCPPVSGEMLSVPLHQLRYWLSDQQVRQLDTEDVEGAQSGESNDEDDARLGLGKWFLIWRGRDKSDVSNAPGDIKPNDVIVVPDIYGIQGVGQPVPFESLGKGQVDIWEPSWASSRKFHALRLNRRVLEPWVGIPVVGALIDLAEDPSTEKEDLRNAIDDLLGFTWDGDSQQKPPDWLLNWLRKLRNARVERHPAGGIVLFEKSTLLARSSEADLFADDDDLTSSLVPKTKATGSPEEVTLEEHSSAVRSAVEKIASRCLPEEFLPLLRDAAFWHDVGKIDERFQLLLLQGNELGNRGQGPLAKSAFVATSPERRRSIRETAKLPQGFRHEFLSCQLAERNVDLSEGASQSDLILHLIASHHGYGRPFAPVVPDPTPPGVWGCHGGVTIELEASSRQALIAPHRVSSGISERFWRLTRRYGWWGLAYLEAVLRLADWYASEHVAQNGTRTSSLQSRSQPQRVCVPAARAQMDLALTGLDGGNPLGFMAAVGVLMILRDRVGSAVRMRWQRMFKWTPVVSGLPSVDREWLCAVICEVLRGQCISGDREEARKEAESGYKKAKKAVEDKKLEIKQRKLRGQALRDARKVELSPLQTTMEARRQEWLSKLTAAVPSEELALGLRIDCTPQEYRQLADRFLDNGNVSSRKVLDLLASFASEACLKNSKEGDVRVKPTPFCFISGSGHQNFLDTVRQLMQHASAESICAVLFDRWTYDDEGLSLRWDPMEARRYALTDRDPSGMAVQTVWMANLLAYRSLSAFPSAPSRNGLKSTGWTSYRSGKVESFTWPLWEDLLDPDSVRSLLLLRELTVESPSRTVLRSLGVSAVFRSDRLKVGTGGNFKISFSPVYAV